MILASTTCSCDSTVCVEISFLQQTVNYIEWFCFWQLEKPITESYAVKPVKFQREEEADPKESAVVETAGWGSLNNLGGRPDKLQELSITVKSRSECGRGDYYGLKFTKNMLCAAERRKDTCDVSFTAMVHKVLTWLL